MSKQLTPTIIEALSAVMTDVQAVRKGDRNTQQNYSFRGIDATVNAVGPAFRAHGIVAIPLKSSAQYRDVQTSTGKPSRECTVIVTYRFYGPNGDYIDAEVPGEAMDSGDKGTPKAMSVAFRTCLLQALCIPTDEPDPDSHSYERAPAQPDGPQFMSAENVERFRTRCADEHLDSDNIATVVKMATNGRTDDVALVLVSEIVDLRVALDNVIVALATPEPDSSGSVSPDGDTDPLPLSPSDESS